MEGVVGAVVEVDPTLDLGIPHLDQGNARHRFEVREHAAEGELGASIGPSGYHGMSKEIQSLKSLAMRSKLRGPSSSARSPRQLTPGSPLNHVRCLRA
jgi:hypothetical protein